MSTRGPSRRWTGLAVLTLLIAAMVPSTSALHADDTTEGYGVFVRFVHDAGPSVDLVATTLVESLTSQGWQILAVQDVGVPTDRCDFDARIIVVHSDGFARTLEPYGAPAAFAVPQRLAVFEDEQGVHIAAANMLNLNRTMVDERVPAQAWQPWHDRLARSVQLAFPDAYAPTEFGQVRDRGRIGKTFGIMAGGPFDEQVETVVELPASEYSVAEIVTRLAEGMRDLPGEWEWGIEPVYSLVLPGGGQAIVGVSGAAVESKAFEIVDRGNDDSREDMMCPGIDHAAAFPIEIVVQEIDDRVEVRIIDEMFRMKMYFEDAGKMAFAKNMGMPGSIEGEIRAKIEAVLR